MTIDIDKLVNDVVKNIYDGKVKEGDINAKTWLDNVQEIWAATEKGMGKPVAKIDYSDPRFELMSEFKNNIQVFAAFKNHQEIADLVKLLKDDTGAVRSFSDFKAEAEKVIGQYNSNWLDSEYNHALASAAMADRWTEFEENADVFPNLKYRTISDDRVRDAHLKLDGIVRPIGHAFWNNFTPPVGWKCRCYLEQTDEEPSDISDDNLPSFEQVPALFRNNPAKTGELFNESHPYFEGMDADVAKKIIKQKNKFVYDSFGSDYEPLYFDVTTGGYAVKHKKHKADERNATTATTLAQKGFGIELVKGAKNAPDFVQDGTVWAVEYVKDINDLEGLIKASADRAKRILLVSDLDIADSLGDYLVEGIKEVSILKGKKLTNIITE